MGTLTTYVDPGKFIVAQAAVDSQNKEQRQWVRDTAGKFGWVAGLTVEDWEAAP